MVIFDTALLMARARKNHLAAALPDITPIGSPITLSGATSGNKTLTLPVAAAAGDSLLVLLNGDTQTATMTGPSGSVNVYSGGFGSDGESYGALVYRLAAADITAGSITVNVQNATQNWTLTAQVFRNISQTPVDVSAFTDSSTAVASPIALTANSITTMFARDMLVYQGVPDRSGSATGTFGAYPAGWTRIADNLHTWSDQTSGYMLQTAAGATGSVSVNYTSTDQAAPGAGLIALRRATPAVSLDISALPSVLHNGQAYSFTVSAQNIDSATGAITITASSLPAGMSIGATTLSGSTYSATISGTPTTNAAAANYAISASNGTQSASQNWNVSVITGGAATVTSANIGWTDGSFKTSFVGSTSLSVQPGDMVVVMLTQATATAVSSITDADGTFTARKSQVGASGHGLSVACFEHAITAAHSNYSITVNLGASINGMVAQVYVLHGSTFTYLSASAVGAANDYASSAASMSMITSAEAVVLTCAMDDYAAQGAFTLSPSGYTIDANQTTGNQFLAAHKIATAAVNDAIQINNPGNAQGGYNRITAIAVAYTY